MRIHAGNFYCQKLHQINVNAKTDTYICKNIGSISTKDVFKIANLGIPILR